MGEKVRGCMSSPFSPDWVVFWTALAALGSIGAVIVATTSIYLSSQLLRAQLEPKVIVYTRPDVDRQSILMIRIENIGRDIARDVSFVSSRPIPDRAWGLDPEKALIAAEMQEGPLITGIPSLGPGDYRDISWGQFGGLAKALNGKPIVLDYSYRFGSRKLIGQTRLEVDSYRGTNGAGSVASAVAHHLETIAKAISALASKGR